MLTLTIGGVDVTTRIKVGTLKKDDNINNKTDTLSFTIESYTGNSYTPALDAEVILTVDSVITFGGRILSYDQNVSAEKVIIYDVTCKDYAIDADRLLIQEQFNNETVDDIIAFLVANYATDFTTVNVNCPITITTITFDRITLSQALAKLAALTNYSYYYDYTKDIHFFERNQEAAPFNLTDTSNNYIPSSLVISRDISQLRNQVYVRGGEIEGAARTELFNGDGVKKTFVLGNKFSSKPTVIVGGVTKTVGIDFLDQETDFDCFWSFAQKYIRFKDSTVPASGTNNISVTGIPLFTLVMRVSDNASILQYGVFEFAAEDKSIKSRDEAKTFGIAQLQAYASDVVEGSFKTYTAGLRSGQLISITSAWRGITEDFLIQKVSFALVNKDVYIYTVTLATLKTMGIIDFLVNLLRTGRESAGDSTIENLEKVLFESEEVTFNEVLVVSKVHNPQTESVTIGEATPVLVKNNGTKFVAGPYVPTGVNRVFILDGSRLG